MLTDDGLDRRGLLIYKSHVAKLSLVVDAAAPGQVGRRFLVVYILISFLPSIFHTFGAQNFQL